MNEFNLYQSATDQTDDLYSEGNSPTFESAGPVTEDLYADTYATAVLRTSPIFFLKGNNSRPQQAEYPMLDKLCDDLAASIQSGEASFRILFLYRIALQEKDRLAQNGSQPSNPRPK